MGLADKSSKDRVFVLGSIFLIANALIWYISANNILDIVVTSVAANDLQKILIWSIHFATLTVSLIMGALVSKKISRKKLLALWTIIGAVSPLPLFVVNLAPIPITLLISIMFGLSLGLGMPTCMEVFTQSTETKKRGRNAGVIMFLSILGVIAVSLLDIGNLQVSATVLATWRLLGLAVLPLQKLPKEEETKTTVSPSTVLKQRAFLLYLVPWLMFSLVSNLAPQVQDTILEQSSIQFLMIIEGIIVAIFAIISGFLIDVVGRKRVAMTGFILLGIGYSILGLFPYEVASWFFYTVLDGISWGIFYVIFVISVWGDLSFNGKSAMYYAIGILPFFFSKYIQLLIGNFIAASIYPYALFSFTAFFLFMAVLPLFYAPETLSEKVMKDRDLKNYIEKATKIAQKGEEKKSKQEKALPTTAKKIETEESDKEYEEAKKLAEKYY